VGTGAVGGATTGAADGGGAKTGPAAGATDTLSAMQEVATYCAASPGALALHVRTVQSAAAVCCCST